MPRALMKSFTLDTSNKNFTVCKIVRIYLFVFSMQRPLHSSYRYMACTVQRSLHHTRNTFGYLVHYRVYVKRSNQQ